MVIQRVRDPLYDLIEFSTDNELERVVWEVIQSKPFQRLRRIKQLGFSELVYPGATHTRFAHSIGVFHTARELMKIVRKQAPAKQSIRENIALVAALVHDVGHGPFSHAFEQVGKKMNLALANHERMSGELIRKGEIGQILDESLGTDGFASNVASMIEKTGRITLHNSVVSSQFDADRLDCMQRDRLMTGSKHSAIDLKWLLANLELGQVYTGLEDGKPKETPTFVIGSKSIQAAEAYVLGLFQLYPTIYFHKATRGAEKLFAEILMRIVKLTRDNAVDQTGLPSNHPLIKFAQDPKLVDNVLSLDDHVVWGALHLLAEAKDRLLSEFAKRLLNRRLYKCCDIRMAVSHRVNPKHALDANEAAVKIDKICANIRMEIGQWNDQVGDGIPRIIHDQAERVPYKSRSANRAWDQITVRAGEELIDIEERSEIVKALRVYKLDRAYDDHSDEKAKTRIKQLVEKAVQEEIN